MDVSLDWVRDYVDLQDLSVADISGALRRSGLRLRARDGDFHKTQSPTSMGHEWHVEAPHTRQDLLGVMGIARELAARLDRPWQWREPRPVRDTHLSTTRDLKITIENDEYCPRLVALRIGNVSPLPSPYWMQKRLLSAGIKPTNLIVDTTRFVSLEYHQTLHVFAENRLRCGALHVRRATHSEMVTTLSGQKVQVETGDLLILDAEGPLSLAGIADTDKAAIDHRTDRIVIVCASLSPGLISATLQRTGLSSSRGSRSVHGTDLTMVPYGALRVAEVLGQEIDAARHRDPSIPHIKVAKDTIDLGVRPSGPRLIAMRLSHGREFLGMRDLSRSQVSQALTRFSFRFVDGTEDRLVFEIPSFRLDIEREIDLLAELSRIMGVDAVPPRTLAPLPSKTRISTP